MSCGLVREGKALFVLTVANAKAYFDPSTLVRASKKTATTLLTKLPPLKKLFAEFLRAQAHEKYIRWVHQAFFGHGLASGMFPFRHTHPP
jgi:hypothetical protein